jgi:hypothetical protein
VFKGPDQITKFSEDENHCASKDLTQKLRTPIIDQ